MKRLYTLTVEYETPDFEKDDDPLAITDQDLVLWMRRLIKRTLFPEDGYEIRLVESDWRRVPENMQDVETLEGGK